MSELSFAEEKSLHLLRELTKFAEDFRAVIAEEIADAIEAEALRIRREDWPGKVGIGYVDGFEDAARIARNRAHPEVTT